MWSSQSTPWTIYFSGSRRETTKVPTRSNDEHTLPHPPDDFTKNELSSVNKLELPFSEAIKPGKGGQTVTDQGLSSEGRFASCRRTFVVVCCISTTKSFFPPNLLQVQQYIGIALVFLLLPVLETSLDQTLHSCNYRVVVSDHPRITVLLRYTLDHEVGSLPICSLRAKLYQSTPSWSSVFV